MRVVEDERPDNWICKTIFENRSSFAVDLVKLQVRMKGSNELLFDIHDVDQDVHQMASGNPMKRRWLPLLNLILLTTFHTQYCQEQPDPQKEQ